MVIKGHDNPGLSESETTAKGHFEIIQEREKDGLPVHKIINEDKYNKISTCIIFFSLSEQEFKRRKR